MKLRNTPLVALKMFTITLIGTFGLCQGTTYATCFTELGVARDFTLLALEGNIDQSGPLPPSGANQNNVQGDIGIASSGFKYQGSGSVNDPGNFLIHSGSTFSTSSSGQTGAVQQGPAIDAKLDQAKAAAYQASATYAQLAPNQTFGTLTSSTTISEAAVGNYVFNLTGINFAGTSTLTLNAPAGSCFILNISGNVSLSGSSKFLLSGGLTPSDVLYNLTSGNMTSGSLQTSGGGNSSVINGIILDPYGAVGIHPGLVNGAIIADSISMSSGASVVGPPPPMIPEVPAVTPLAAVMGLVVGLTHLRRRGAAFLSR